LIVLPPAGRSVGIGLSPGDHYYDEPYFYVSAYPSSAPEALPPWDELGHWHTTEFTSLILTASEWQSTPHDADVSTWRVVERAIAVSKQLLETVN
jgi:hypothetical protein